jgi:ADP-heptose:LPS heptosyltransferase
MNKNNLKKVLIFRLGAIGDVVHTTGLVRALKNHDSEISIHYLTTGVPAKLLKYDHDIDKIWISEDKSYSYIYNLAKDIKKENYDLLINLQPPTIRNKVFAYLINAKKTLNYKKDFNYHAVENFFITAKPAFEGMTLDNALKLFIPDNLKNKFHDSGMLIGFNMGVSGTRQGRRWLLQNWKDLAKLLIDKYNCKIVLTGSNDDKEFSEQILDVSSNIISYCGKLDILENTALLSVCNVVISGDTGPLHIASATGIPVIGLYGAAPVSRTGPYGSHATALFSERNCVPCNRRKCKYIKKGDLYTPCMEDLSAERVFNEVKKMLNI